MVPIKNSNGFNLVEMMIVAVLIAGGIIASSRLIVNIQRSQNKILETSEANEFAASLGHYLNQYCKLELEGDRFPSDNPTALTLTEYKNYGGMSFSEIKEGTKFQDRWRVTKLEWRHKSNIPDEEYKRGDETYTLSTAQITLGLETISSETAHLGEDNPAGKNTLEEYIIEIPFIVDGEGKVSDCLSSGLGPSGQDVCEMMGSEYEEVDNLCTPNNHCFIVTQLVNCSSMKGAYPACVPQSPCATLIQPELNIGGVSQYLNFFHDDSGDQLGSCPTGTKMIFTGNIVKTGSCSCGPGCQNSYVAEGKVYLCLQCNLNNTTGVNTTTGSTTSADPP